jgi:hypothetical protein
MFPLGQKRIQKKKSEIQLGETQNHHPRAIKLKPSFPFRIG